MVEYSGMYIEILVFIYVYTSGRVLRYVYVYLSSQMVQCFAIYVCQWKIAQLHTTNSRVLSYVYANGMVLSYACTNGIELYFVCTAMYTQMVRKLNYVCTSGSAQLIVHK